MSNIPGRHLFWTDFAEYHAVCSGCFDKIHAEQWTGHTGYSWPRAMKERIKRQAEEWLPHAKVCAECGQLLPLKEATHV